MSCSACMKICDRLCVIAAADLRVLAAEDLLRELEHARLVGLGHAEDAHDDVQRVVERDVAHEVALAVVLEHPVDEAPGEHGQPRADLLPQVRRLEPVVRDRAVAAVLGAVHVDQRLDVDAELRGCCSTCARGRSTESVRVPEERVVALDLRDVARGA